MSSTIAAARVASRIVDIRVAVSDEHVTINAMNPLHTLFKIDLAAARANPAAYQQVLGAVLAAEIARLSGQES